jgi:hypothetical protein
MAPGDQGVEGYVRQRAQQRDQKRGQQLNDGDAGDGGPVAPTPRGPGRPRTPPPVTTPQTGAGRAGAARADRPFSDPGDGVTAFVESFVTHQLQPMEQPVGEEEKVAALQAALQEMAKAVKALAPEREELGFRQLKLIHGLLADGAITDEEYQNMKLKIKEKYGI